MNFIKEMTKVDSAWISPEGDLYLCVPYSHYSKAVEICQSIGIKDEELLKSRADDCLYNRKWIAVDYKYVLSNNICKADLSTVTQKQIDTLFDIMVHLNFIKARRKTLVKNIGRIISNQN